MRIGDEFDRWFLKRHGIIEYLILLLCRLVDKSSNEKLHYFFKKLFNMDSIFCTLCKHTTTWAHVKAHNDEKGIDVCYDCFMKPNFWKRYETYLHGASARRITEAKGKRW